MIARYLDRGEMFALYDDDLKSICVVTQEGKNLYEIKNLATYPPFQRQGYARRLIEYIENRYNAPGTILQVGTGDSPLTIPFYEHCGFRYSHRIPRFFTDNYPRKSSLYSFCKNRSRSAKFARICFCQDNLSLF